MNIPHYYANLLAVMPVNKVGKKTAPHKAVLLLTIVDMIENGEISSSFIPLSDRINDAFVRTWRVNVPASSNFSPKISYPFYHLSSSSFWKLIKSQEYIGQKEYSSLSSLKRDYTGAIIDEELFRLMKDPKARDEIRAILTSSYLSQQDISSTSSLSLVSIIAIICAVA